MVCFIFRVSTITPHVPYYVYAIICEMDNHYCFFTVLFVLNTWRFCFCGQLKWLFKWYMLMLIIAQLCLKVIVWIICIVVDRNNWKFCTYWFWCQNPTVLEARGLLGRECRPCDSYVKVGQLIMNIVWVAHTIHPFINLCLKETIQHLKRIFNF